MKFYIVIKINVNIDKYGEKITIVGTSHGIISFQKHMYVCVWVY